MSRTADPGSRDAKASHAKVIEEFRANHGEVTSLPVARHLLLLTTKGTKTQQRRTSPLAYLSEDERMYVIGTVLGAPRNPEWSHNLTAYPDVTVEVGSDTIDATATVLEGAEREHIWEQFDRMMPNLQEWQEQVTRVIPIVNLKPDTAPMRSTGVRTRLHE